MAEKKYFANTAKITAGGKPVGIGKSIEITVEFEYVELYGFGSIIRQGVSKHTAKVPVKIASAAFDGTFATGLGFVYGCTLNASSSDTATSITDTNQVALFDIIGEFTADDGTKGLKITVTGVYFENLPFIFSENEYANFELSGNGSQATVLGTWS